MSCGRWFSEEREDAERNKERKWNRGVLHFSEHAMGGDSTCKNSIGIKLIEVPSIAAGPGPR